MAKHSPRPWSSLSKVLQYLQSQPADTWRNVVELADACQLPRGNVSACLSDAANKGVLRRRLMNEDSRRVEFALPAADGVAPPPPETALERYWPAPGSAAASAQRPPDAEPEARAPAAAAPVDLEPAQPPAAPAEPPAQCHFACALRSDDRLLLESGEARLTLPADHTRALFRYLSRFTAFPTTGGQA